jgi:hypothetical protein
VGPRAGLDGCEKPRTPPGFEPWTVLSVTSHYTGRDVPGTSVATHVCVYGAVEAVNSYGTLLIFLKIYRVFSQKIRLNRNSSIG